MWLWLVTVNLWSQSLPQTGQTTTTLQTGQGLTLQQTSLPFIAPTNLAAVSLTFEVGFGTAETIAPSQFFDAFSVSLANPNPLPNALLLTADVFGMTWAPVDPQGQGLTNRFLFETAPLPTFSLPYALRYAYDVAVEIPALLFGATGKLLLSLFDNHDPDASAGFVRDISVGPSLNTPLVLESSPAVNGPFGEEMGVRIDRIQRTLTLPAGGSARFYRLRGQSLNRIKRLRLANGQLLFDYEAAPVQVNLVLLTANSDSQVYHEVPEARFDLTNKTVTVPSALVGPLLQLQGNVIATITGRSAVGPNQVLTFQYTEPVPILESATQAQGPYAPESGVTAIPVTGQLSIPQSGQARFFRLRSDTPLVIRLQEQSGNDWIHHYDLP